MMNGINFNMKCPSAEQEELDRLRKIWDKFKSLMLQRRYTGFASIAQSLFIAELCKCSSDLENDLGIPTGHLRTFDSFLARFEDQCMLKIFLKFERFKLIFLQAEHDDSEPGWENEAEGSNINEKIEFSFGPTNPESIQDDFILIKDVPMHDLTCEKKEMNEERAWSEFVATEDRNKNMVVNSAIKADCSHSQSVSEQTSPDMCSVRRLQNNSKNETLTGNCNNVNISPVKRQQNNSKNETLTGNCNNVNISPVKRQQNNSKNETLTENCKNVNISPVRKLQNNSKNETLTENCNNVTSIHERSRRSVTKHLKGKILLDFQRREIKREKTSLMKQASFCHNNSKGVVNRPGKRTHTLNPKRIRDTIHCLERGFVNEDARLLNEPGKPHANVLAEHRCCNYSAVIMQETSLANSCNCSVHCKQQRESKPESPPSLDNKCSASDELPKQNSSNSKMSLSYEELAQPATLQSDSKICLKNELRHKQLKCEICQTSFQRAANLKRHMLTHSERNAYVHKICGSSSANRSHRNNRRLSDPRNKPFQCGICGAEFSESTKLKSHKQVHAAEKQFICEVCGASFSILSSLKNHMRIHSDEKPYKCDICDFATTHSSNLKVHLLVHSGEKKYSCDQCSSRFSDNAKLKRHVMTHTGEKPYRCQACGVAFADKSHLTVHLRIHSGETPFKCTFCSAAFVESSKLKIHLRTHTGEKPYMCEICGMSFAVAYGLKSHMRRHTGEKLYKCNVCAYATSQSSNLKTHMYVHTAARPHVCDMCGAAFSESSKLTRHRVTHQD